MIEQRYIIAFGLLALLFGGIIVFSKWWFKRVPPTLDR